MRPIRARYGDGDQSEMTRRIWVVGEVLIDEIDGVVAVGGGPANTARALARLGESVEFIGGISTDRFGHMAWMELAGDGVGLDLSFESDKPTAKAIAKIGAGGSARYSFQLDGSATFDFSRHWLPTPASEIVLYLGTLAAVIEPGASELYEWVKQIKQEKSIEVIFDPNVRPAVINDRELYSQKIEKWIGQSELIKASSEDIAWLYPDLSELEVVERWQNLGAKIVLLTNGVEGITGYGEETVTVSGYQVDVIDTVGAGDSVGAVIAQAVKEYGTVGLDRMKLERVLDLAAKAGAITCTRQGALAPTAAELERF